MAILALSLIAGLMTIFNPCVLPLAPVLVAGANARDIRGPLALAGGLALTFGVVGGLVASLGLEIGESSLIRVPAGLILVPLGLILLIPRAADRVADWLGPLTRWGEGLAQRIPDAGVWGNAGLGALLALVWAPCIGPTMGAALVMAASSGTRPLAIASMMVFAVGAAVSLLVAGFGLRMLARGGRSRAMVSAKWAKMAFGVVLIAVGIGALTGLDHWAEARMVEILPDWFIRFATVF